MRNLWDISRLKQLLKLIDFRSNCIIIVGKFMCFDLQWFAALYNAKFCLKKNYHLLIIDFLIVSRKVTELVTKLCSFISGLSFNFPSKCLDIINILRANILFNSKQFKIKIFLVRFLQESNKEFGSFKNWRFQDLIEESLVEQNSLCRVVFRKLLLSWIG